MSSDKNNIVVIDFSSEPAKALGVMVERFKEAVQKGGVRAACVILVSKNGEVDVEYSAVGNDGHYLIGGAEMLQKAIVDDISDTDES